MKNNVKNFTSDQSGAVAIEFVLLAPLLMALLFGIMTMGYFMGVSHSVNQLATEAARVSVAGLDQTERSELVTAYLSKASTHFPLLMQNSIAPSVVFEGLDQASITVNVTYSVDGTVLEIANGFLGLGIENIQGSAYLAY